MKWFNVRDSDTNKQSPPSRGAWIEIAALVNPFCVAPVAPLAGGVD